VRQKKMLNLSGLARYRVHNSLGCKLVCCTGLLLVATWSNPATVVGQESSGSTVNRAASESAIQAWKTQLSEASSDRATYSPGKRIEYQRGHMCLILAAAHGGRLTPDDLPNRTTGTLVSDTNVDRLARSIQQELAQLAVAEAQPAAKRPAASSESARLQPHLVICHVHRRKLDANRPLEAACAEDSPAQLHWHEYQQAILHAKRCITAEQGRGLFVELHGHSHPIARLELGYLLRENDFELPVSQFNQLGARTSLREVVEHQQYDAEQLIRGQVSLGHFLAEENIASVPSPANPKVGKALYFNGGWNTLQHGSRDQGTISSIQIECHMRGVRDSEEAIASSAASIGRALWAFLKLHYPEAVR